MNSMTRMSPLVALVLVNHAVCLGAEPSKAEQQITIRSGKFGATYPYGGDGGAEGVLLFKARVREVVEASGGLVAQDITTNIDYTLIRFPKKPPNHGARYSEFHEDELVPIYRRIYRVARLTKGTPGANESGHEVVLEWVPEDKLPPGVELGDDPVLVPLDGTSSDGRWGLKTEKIEGKLGADGKPESKVSAEITVTHPNPDRPPFVQKLSRATVRIGDTLLVGEYGLKVRNIVPRDEKTRVIGWVEFAPDGIKKADLDRDKIAYITPEPVKVDKK